MNIKENDWEYIKANNAMRLLANGPRGEERPDKRDFSREIALTLNEWKYLPQL